MVRPLEALKADVETHLTAFPDFPKPGIIFRDIFSLVANSALFHELCLSIADHIRSLGTKVDAVAGLEARGFLFGPTIAHALGIPFIPIRKKGKLPGEVVQSSYEKEYGTDTVEMQANAIKPHDNIFIVDDLLATGGTMSAAIQLVQRAGGRVSEAFVVVELTTLKGREKLPEGANLYSLVHFDI
ncbi:hypothetical protein QR680_009003 [Steinernema hermaphroditum]|uniref:Adenine phosphoribosyltransferase n=1 Tax=Steinernema hermaphroditum TaxID=289476 RepID=A0AA39IIN3_9BILA|nr:hypothetical protein QR680_009003 [Steinernema hermaphroditum]